MLRAILDYFWPSPPKEVSRESTVALRADIKAASIWGEQLGDTNRDSVDVWVRHSDRQSRAANREWLKSRSGAFSRRWAVVSCVLWLGAWIVAGHVVAEVPLTLAGSATGVVAMGFFFTHRALNK